MTLRIFNQELITAFRNKIQGTVIIRDEKNYEKKRQDSIWNGYKPERYPDFLVVAKSDQDIKVTIDFAREHKLFISPKVSGHSYSSSFLRDTGILLDLSLLQQININKEDALIIAQPGVTSKQLSTFLEPHGLAFPVGHGDGVTIGGFLLGGGVGINGRAWGGMSTFSIQALDIILPDGKHVHASNTENQDLFWAARGGGAGLFFVVTRFYLKAYPLPQYITACNYIFPFSELSVLADFLDRTCHKTDVRLQIMLAVIARPEALRDIPALANEDRIIALSSFAFANNESEAIKLHQEFGAYPELQNAPIREDNATLSFNAIFEQSKGILIDECIGSDNILTDSLIDAIKIIKHHYLASPSLNHATLIMWRGLQNFPDAMCSVKGKYFISTYAQWKTGTSSQPHRKWLKALFDDLNQIASSRYINEFDQEGRSTTITTCYTPENIQRFERLRNAYDPLGIFPGFLQQSKR